jgi:hypothetical protein
MSAASGRQPHSEVDVAQVRFSLSLGGSRMLKRRQEDQPPRVIALSHAEGKAGGGAPTCWSKPRFRASQCATQFKHRAVKPSQLPLPAGGATTASCLCVQEPEFDLPTATALVRLRLLAEDAQRRIEDVSPVGRHVALVALDGACEYALWLASRMHGVPVKSDRASVPDLYNAVRHALGERWQVRGWAGVNQLHRARNDAQHAGVVPAADQLPHWCDAAVAFIDSLCIAAFEVSLTAIVLADAVRDASLRRQLQASEEVIYGDPGRALLLAMSAFQEAREQWRTQRRPYRLQRQFPPSSWLDRPPTGEIRDQLRELDDFLEVQLFAGDAGEYIWLQRAHDEQQSAGWTPTPEDARRALLFITGWIVRWEIFNSGYTADRWDEYRGSIEPPTVGDGGTPQIIGAQTDFQPEAPGRPARCILYFQLANIPDRGRSPWDMLLRNGLFEAAKDAGQPSLFAHIQWFYSGLLLVHVDLSSDCVVVCDVVAAGLERAFQRHREQRVESEASEHERQELEEAVCEIVQETRNEELGLFGNVRIVADRWLGTGGWLAFIDVDPGAGGSEELTQTVGIFGNSRATFPQLHVRDECVVFSVDRITPDLTAALKTAIADSEAQASHLRCFREEQARAFEAFSTGIHKSFPRLQGRGSAFGPRP